MQMLIRADRVLAVVGRQSAGTNGNITGLSLPDRFLITYTGLEVKNPDGSPFFGIGIVEPVDEPGDENPASHPELLDALATGLVEAKFDQKLLIRAIVASRAYNLTSRKTHASQTDPRRFARMPVRGLTADQIYDSFLAATGETDRTPRNQRFFDQRNDAGRNAFRSLYTSAAIKTTETQTSILQSLMMMNSDVVLLEAHAFAERVMKDAGDDRHKQIDTAWRLAYVRLPDESERASSVQFLDEQAATFKERLAQPEFGELSKTHTPERMALDSFCQTLVGANGFLYAD